MARALGFSFLLVVLLCATGSLQLGTLWVNQINGNYDTHMVVIEEVQIQQDTMKVDYINGLGGNPVVVENVTLSNGSVSIPDDLYVGEVATITGLLNANGGILASAYPNGGFSFQVQAFTGITTIEGELFPNGGINVDSGLFTVAAGTGETTIASALLNANGGIDVNNGLFTVDASTGNTLTQGNLYVYGNIQLGDTASDDLYIQRLAANGNYGGSTYIVGQSSTVQGGDLILEPGYGTTIIGQILLGRANPDTLYFGRISTTSGSDGGTTTFQGQDASDGNGGNLYIRAGNSGGSSSQGGNLILSPGYSLTNGVAGDIILGSDNCESDPCNGDLYVTRPTPTGNGGKTIFSGQDSTNGNGGDLYLQAGSGTGTPGDINLVPGLSDSRYGFIYLGDSTANDIYLTRVPSSDSAGDLYIIGQDSSNNQGGSIYLEAGIGGEQGGSIYLTPGTGTSSNQISQIIVGNADSALIISRPDPTTGQSGTATTIQGQASTFGSGGDVSIIAGAATTSSGGSISVSAGAGTASGGNVQINAGSGNSGGSIILTAGSGASAGGDVSLTISSSGGNVFLASGTGSQGAGSIYVQNTGHFQVDGSVIMNGGILNFQSYPCVDATDPSGCTTQPKLQVGPISSGEGYSLISFLDPTVSSTPRRIIGSAILQVSSPTSSNSPTLSSSSSINDVITVVNQLQQTVIQLVDALGQCGHGLVQVVTPDGINAYTGCGFFATAPAFSAPNQALQ